MEGQEVYYATHSFFLTDRAIYLVILNLSDVNEMRSFTFFHFFEKLCFVFWFVFLTFCFLFLSLLYFVVSTIGYIVCLHMHKDVLCFSLGLTLILWATAKQRLWERKIFCFERKKRLE